MESCNYELRYITIAVSVLCISTLVMLFITLTRVLLELSDKNEDLYKEIIKKFTSEAEPMKASWVGKFEPIILLATHKAIKSGKVAETGIHIPAWYGFIAKVFVISLIGMALGLMGAFFSMADCV